MRFGTRIVRATLETMIGWGHIWDCWSFRKLGESVRGAIAYSESGWASSGSCTSMKSPDQIVSLEGGARSTNARRAEALKPEEGDGVTSRLAGRSASSFFSMNRVLARMSISKFSTTRPSNFLVVTGVTGEGDPGFIDDVKFGRAVTSTISLLDQP